MTAQVAVKGQSSVEEQAAVKEQQATMLEEAAVVAFGHGPRRPSSPDVHVASGLEMIVEVQL